jgi:hypothetical protein
MAMTESTTEQGSYRDGLVRLQQDALFVGAVVVTAAVLLAVLLPAYRVQVIVLALVALALALVFLVGYVLGDARRAALAVWRGAVIGAVPGLMWAAQAVHDRWNGRLFFGRLGLGWSVSAAAILVFLLARAIARWRAGRTS